MCSEIRQVWAQHLTSRLVDQESNILIRDRKIVDRITDFYKRWKALKQDSERKERATTQNFVNKVSAFKDEVNKPMNISGILECASFQSIIYCKYWFQCPIPVMAPLLDLQYYGKLLNWKQVSPTQAFSLTKLQRKHLWYLTPELVTLSLFDQHVPAEVIII